MIYFRNFNTICVLCIVHVFLSAASTVPAQQPSGGCEFDNGNCVYKVELSHTQGKCSSGQTSTSVQMSSDVLAKLGDTNTAVLKLQGQQDRSDGQMTEVFALINGVAKQIETGRGNDTATIKRLEAMVTALQQTFQSQASLVLKLSQEGQRLASVVQQVQEENKKLTGDLKATESALNTLRNKTQEDKVAFAVGRSKYADLIAKQIDIRVTFDTIFTNHGNGFETQNSVFRSPIDGAYMFTMTMLSDHGAKGRVYLYLNGAYQTEMFGFHPVQSETGTNQVILDLNAGDQVWLVLPAGHAIHGNGQSVYMTFTGHLLFSL